MQLIFADVLNQTLQVSENVGETYTTRPTPFTPNRILFQSRVAPNSTQYSKFILGYDSTEETVKTCFLYCFNYLLLIFVGFCREGNGLSRLFLFLVVEIYTPVDTCSYVV